MRSSLAENFSITNGGAVHRIFARFGQAKEGRSRIFGRAVAIVLITWLPLLILSLAGGEAYGATVTVPFLRDLAVNFRFLIALPILVLAESPIDRRWRSIVLEFLRSGLVDEQELTV